MLRPRPGYMLLNVFNVRSAALAASPQNSDLFKLPFITLFRSLQAMRSLYLSTLITTGSLALAMGSAFADDVKSDQPVKDSYITTKVKADLAKDKGTSATNIHVTTKDGVVMLDGTVASQAEKELAEKDAKRVKGVVGVHNGLDVK